ncbi:MAG: hypothetical protein U0L72_00330 [Acutalibacteraceae bacterium]|nr:hypothetical protein [Acutalibacteraceae bacterium]
MTNTKSKIFLVSLLSVSVILGTLIGAAVLSEMNSKGFDSEFPQTQYSSVLESSSQATVTSSQSKEEMQEDTISDTEYIIVNTGTYINGNDRILVKSCEYGFVEGSVLCGGITMEFSGQTVDKSLTATGTDNFNNTIEITLIFEENKINASSKPLIRYEEATDFLELNGVFVK